MMQNQRVTRNRLATAKGVAQDENAVPKTRAGTKAKQIGLQAPKDVGKPALLKKASTAAGPKRQALGEVSSNQIVNDKDKENAQPVKRQLRAATQKKTVEVRDKVKENALPRKIQEKTATVTATKFKSETVVVKTSRRENKAQPAPTVNVKHVMNDAVDSMPVAKKVKTAEPSPQWADLDAEDIHDPMMVAEYVEDVFEYLKKLEVETMAKPNYMDEQKDLQWKMRSILVDWLIEVHEKFRLLPETLYLAINIIDRFLTVRVVSLVKLQLVGVTAMFIAAKYEEVLAPSIHNFLFMADGGYTDEEVLKAERYVLQVLDFALQYPSPMSFLRRCSKADNYDVQTRTVAKYLMEISLIDHRFLPHVPSKVAAAGMCLAREMLGRGPWDATLEHYSGYKLEEVEPVIQLMTNFLENDAFQAKYSALFKKYSSRKYLKASTYVKDWIDQNRNRSGDECSEEDYESHDDVTAVNTPVV
ncbi:cyclin-like protein [Phlyctochytrium arcticum]|nr:cyclin-like protein [Phlyctochytrium arcticum]